MRGRVRQISRSWRKWHDATSLFFQSLTSGPSLAVEPEGLRGDLVRTMEVTEETEITMGTSLSDPRASPRDSLVLS